MKASQARATSIESAEKEINNIKNLINKACKESKTHINLDELSEAANSYFIDNGYIVETESIMINYKQAIIPKSGIKISW